GRAVDRAAGARDRDGGRHGRPALGVPDRAAGRPRRLLRRVRARRRGRPVDAADPAPGRTVLSAAFAWVLAAVGLTVLPPLRARADDGGRWPERRCAGS